MLNISDLAEDTIDVGLSPEALLITALGTKSEAAAGCEVILIAYLCQVTRQQVMLSQYLAGGEWYQTPAAVPGVDFQDCIMARAGSLAVPRLDNGFLAVISHPWSGFVVITTPKGEKQIDLYSDIFKVLLIDTDSGVTFEADPVEVRRLRLTFADMARESAPVDQREAGTPSPAGLLPDTALDLPAKVSLASHSLCKVVVQVAKPGPSSDSVRLVTIVEFEPIAGMFVDLARIIADIEWSVGQLDQARPSQQTALSSHNGTLRLQAALSGSIVFLMGPEAGIVEVEILGRRRKFDLLNTHPKLLRVHFDDRQMLPSSPKLHHVQSAVIEGQGVDAARHRKDFYTAALNKLDPDLPTGLYVPRWKGVAASTKNLFAQTLPCPFNADGHPSDVSAEDVKFYAGVLLSSGVRHFIVSGGDTFWIDIIRRVQGEEPRARFDLLWHSNYLQMGEPHDWNLLKYWQRAIADGLVTKVAVVKDGLEQIFSSFGAETVFIPNFVRGDPSKIRYNGPRDVVGIWLSGSSSYRKVPFASLLALKALPQVRLIGAGFDDDSLAMVTEMRIPRGEISRLPLPQEALYRCIQRTGLTLYVTLSECSPMLPLESMHLGVPCLVAASSHLFRCHPYLYRTLVVKSPLSSETIAAHAKTALAEGEDIIAAFQEYSHQEQQVAKSGLKRLLE